MSKELIVANSWDKKKGWRDYRNFLFEKYEGGTYGVKKKLALPETYVHRQFEKHFEKNDIAYQSKISSKFSKSGFMATVQGQKQKEQRKIIPLAKKVANILKVDEPQTLEESCRLLSKYLKVGDIANKEDETLYEQTILNGIEDVFNQVFLNENFSFGTTPLLSMLNVLKTRQKDLSIIIQGLSKILAQIQSQIGSANAEIEQNLLKTYAKRLAGAITYLAQINKGQYNAKSKIESEIKNSFNGIGIKFSGRKLFKDNYLDSGLVTLFDFKASREGLSSKEKGDTYEQQLGDNLADNLSYELTKALEKGTSSSSLKIKGKTIGTKRIRGKQQKIDFVWDYSFGVGKNKVQKQINFSAKNYATTNLEFHKGGFSALTNKDWLGKQSGSANFAKYLQSPAFKYWYSNTVFQMISSNESFLGMDAFLDDLKRMSALFLGGRSKQDEVDFLFVQDKIVPLSLILERYQSAIVINNRNNFSNNLLKANRTQQLDDRLFPEGINIGKTIYKKANFSFRTAQAAMNKILSLV